MSYLSENIHIMVRGLILIEYECVDSGTKLLFLLCCIVLIILSVAEDSTPFVVLLTAYCSKRFSTPTLLPKIIMV